MRNRNHYGLKNFFLAFWLFSVCFSMVCILLFQNLEKGFILGCLAGLLYAAGTSIFTNVISKKMVKIRRVLETQSTVIYDDGANHWVGKEAAGGWLFLLEDSLYFVSHKGNITVHECKIPYQEIESVGKGKKMRSICIERKNGKKEEFVVNGCKKWTKLIETQMEAGTR